MHTRRSKGARQRSVSPHYCTLERRTAGSCNIATDCPFLRMKLHIHTSVLTVQMTSVIPQLHVVLAGRQSGKPITLRQSHRPAQTSLQIDCCIALHSRLTHRWQGLVQSSSSMLC